MIRPERGQITPELVKPDEMMNREHGKFKWYIAYEGLS